MADEIKATLNVTITNGQFKETISPGTLEIDQAAIGRGGGVQAIGTSAETVAVGDVSTLGMCYMRNLDATNFVTIGPDSSGQVDFIKLLPGEWCWLRLKPGITIKATADTAECKLEVRVFQN